MKEFYKTLQVLFPDRPGITITFHFIKSKGEDQISGVSLSEQPFVIDLTNISQLRTNINDHSVAIKLIQPTQAEVSVFLGDKPLIDLTVLAIGCKKNFKSPKLDYDYY